MPTELASADSSRRFARRIRRSVIAVITSLLLTSLLAIYALWEVADLSATALGKHASDLYLAQELRLRLQRAISADRAFLFTGDRAHITKYEAEQIVQEYTVRRRRQKPNQRQNTKKKSGEAAGRMAVTARSRSACSPSTGGSIRR